MIDIETISPQADAIILNIGVIGFNPFTDEIYTDHSFYSRINVETQTNRHEDENTLKWWMSQSKEAQEESFGDGDRIELDVALDEVSKIARKCGRIWTNGIAFDMPIMEHAYRLFSKSIPWQYYKVFDTRTVFKLNPVDTLGNSHHALEDCINQIVLLQKCLKRLGIHKVG